MPSAMDDERGGYVLLEVRLYGVKPSLEEIVQQVDRSLRSSLDLEYAGDLQVEVIESAGLSREA